MIKKVATQHTKPRSRILFFLAVAVLSPLAKSGPYTDAKFLLYDGSDPEFINVYNIGEPFLPPSVRIQPLKASKDAIVSAVDIITSAGFNDKIGAVAFASAIVWSEPLTTDFSRIRTKLRGSPLGVGTGLSIGIEAGIQELTSDRARDIATKMMVLVTDGRADPTGALNQVEIARDEGIIVHVIGVGNGIDTAWLEELATSGGGTFIQVDITTPTIEYAALLQAALSQPVSNEFGVTLIR